MRFRRTDSARDRLAFNVTSSGTGSGGTDAIEIVSVTHVRSLPGIPFSRLASFCSSSAFGWRKIRALRSPAISDRASVIKVVRKLSLKPRTPTSAATPTATERTTKANLPGADFRSRQPMAAARCQVRARSAILLLVLDERLDGIRGQRVFDDHAVFQNDLAIGAGRYFRIVRDQHEGRAGVAVALEEQIEHQTSVGGVEVAGGFIGHHDRRVDNKSAGQRDALLFASGELNWIVIHALAQADSFEQAIALASDRCLRR